ncbi:MAG TPA: (d)CMP kinase [Bdellovibrionales bacterium]|nr:MAG: cytidylate kinase [Bdellovibrionales bacterium GWB1_52_6]OFZ06298.1 MAG: cytidylate kinase [Bdellovibrionales bacterium GWA1_52_35]OFZ36141.1 MAG: cytidylate kinase [Bdellovibrionales bacterium GWC1_52_8]HAR42055.1 (d)CMP kinase [Bdellovibrionales bacterium]HCM40047.1 (d)CMP kinase [Bdellovibrionales bacterium]
MIPKLGPVVAIDGPAGSGKSSATRRLCEALGFVHVDTGALYRAIALVTLEKMQARQSAAAAEQITEEDCAGEVARSAHLEFRRVEGKAPSNRIFANNRDVTEFIRSPEISMAASRVSAYPGVRAALLGLQRRLGCVGKSVLEGRDIGTVIFPDADVKFFLLASVDERAKRRLRELTDAAKKTGAQVPTYEELREQIETRDSGDSTRAIAPLKKAPDAIEVDTTRMTLDEVVEFMTQKVRERLG